MPEAIISAEHAGRRHGCPQTFTADPADTSHTGTGLSRFRQVVGFERVLVRCVAPAGVRAPDHNLKRGGASPVRRPLPRTHQEIEHLIRLRTKRMAVRSYFVFAACIG